MRFQDDSLLLMANSNPYFKNLCEKKPRINAAIAAFGSNSIITFADNLQAQGLINQPIHDQATSARGSALEGASVLMTAVQDQIKNFPNKYGKLITALKDSGMGHIVEILEEGFSEFEENNNNVDG